MGRYSTLVNRVATGGRWPWWAGARRCGVGLILALGIFIAQAGAVPSDETRVTLSGSIAGAPPAAGPNSSPETRRITRATLRPEEESATMEFSVALKMRDLGGLQGRVARGETISPGEMSQKYFPLSADYEATVAWLTSQGFTITNRDPSRLAVFARGTVAQVRAAFQISFARVSRRGAEFTSAITAPTVPASLASVVIGVNGLQPELRKHTNIQAQPDSATGNVPPFFPLQIAKAYGANGLSVTGAGQTIAIVIDAFPSTADLTQFWSTCGISQSLGNVTFVPVSGGPTSSSDANEASLDVEWSSSIASGAKIRVYGPGSLDDTALDQAYAQIYADVTTQPSLNIHIASMSYGGDESQTPFSQLQTDSQYFAELASAGVTLFASSGDGGSTPDGILTPESPATDPNVTGVGGTSITLNSSTGAVSTETAWSDGGGGVSEFFPLPSWQTGTNTQAVYDSGGKRMVPDVAAPADPTTGALLVLNGLSQTVGGTSWGSPTWAGFCALINQARANAGEPTLSALNPKIYPLLGTASFRDITSGNNGYPATTSYDLCTGLGAPNVATLLQQLTTVLTPPGTQTVLSGQNAVFSLTSAGSDAASFQWQRMASGTSAWVNLSDSATYSGSLSSTLTVNAATGAMSGDQFQCVVGLWGGGSATSLPMALIVITQLYVSSTVAGVANLNLSSSDGVGANAAFALPNDVAVDSSGNVYIADTLNDTVRKMTPAGNVTTLAGKAGVTGSTNNSVALNARFNFINSIDLDSSGNIYLADSSNDEIRKITTTGNVTTFAGKAGTSGTTNGTGGSARFNFPAGVAVDSSGNVFVADSNNNQIRKITAAGVVTTIAGNATTAGYLDGSGTTAEFNFPAAIAVDSAGNLYVADANNNVIRKVTQAGVVTTLAGSSLAGVLDGTGAHARFNYPSGIAVDTAGNVFVADTNNDAIRKITPDGVVTTVLGQPGNQGSADGLGNVAQLNQPYGLVVDASGNIFIADTLNNTIRKGALATAPQIQTQPQNQVATAGQSATFTVVATGIPAPNYLWQILAAGASVWSNLTNNGTVTGAATASLVLSNVTTAMGGNQYQCVVSNVISPSATSAAATLTVEPPGYAAWAASLGLAGANALPTATPFPDGLTNLARFAMNLGGAPSSAQLPAASFQSESYTNTNIVIPATLTLQYRQLKSLSTVQITVQYSVDLINWYTLPSSLIRQLPDADAQTSVYQASISIPPGQPIFLRLQIAPN
jgi:kumamolisin